MINSLRADTVEDFYKYVTEEFKNIQSYQVPTDNKNVFTTCDSKIRRKCFFAKNVFNSSI